MEDKVIEELMLYSINLTHEIIDSYKTYIVILFIMVGIIIGIILSFL